MIAEHLKSEDVERGCSGSAVGTRGDVRLNFMIGAVALHLLILTCNSICQAQLQSHHMKDPVTVKP